MSGNILVTGGAGYIGSHTCIELAAAGYEPVIADNFSNSRRSVLERVHGIAGRAFKAEEGDIRDAAFLDGLFARHRFDCVIHFAGLKAVGESVAQPLLYYDNNVAGTLVLLEAMRRAGLRNMVFSSSATVYGEAGRPPFGEASPLGPTNPYGRTKLMVEWMLQDLARAEPGWRVVLLRYFNPVGAHASGTIGEDPRGTPNNLLPYVTQVAVGRLKELSVFGNDYPTHDGTGVRDYIHVVDLALGHVAAVKALDRLEPVSVFNLGTGNGHSVLEVVAAFERAAGLKLPYRIAPRRAGDVAFSFADPAHAASVLHWRAVRDLDAMCRDAWRWQQWYAAHEAEIV
jgi:UDP-glucose 4-epimerase